MNADTNSKAADTAALVQEGWRHLRAQRPIAAWAFWQRALRLEPENAPALSALERLSAAPFLPAIAREEQRLRSPGNSEQRARWDRALKKNRTPGDLAIIRDAFAAIAGADPADAAALFNEALCNAWLGRNLEAIAALDRAAAAVDASDLEPAIIAAMLAEVLRQGGGAERVADDLAHTLVLPWDDPNSDPLDWLGGLTHAPLRALPRPFDPLTGRPLEAGERAFEWLDRPLPTASAALSATDLPRVLASLVVAPGELRFSSPIPDQLERIEDDLNSSPPPRAADHAGVLEFDRLSIPLPFPVIDAAVWRFRLPDGLDAETRHRLLREAVEDYYEIEWVEQPRHALGGMTPQTIADFLAVNEAADPNLNASQRLARAKLEALVRYREQLASRPHVAALHAGYPFDCLRARLGLETLAPDGPAESQKYREADS